MRASKENTDRAIEVAQRLLQPVGSAAEADAEFLVAFLKKAKKKLPYDKSYTADANRKRSKNRGRPVQKERV